MGLLEKKLSSAQIIILGFAAVILLGSFLLMLPISTQDGQGSTFTDALFTATSAVCVTGLVVQDTATYWTTFGQVVVISLIQIGGMGVVTVAVAVALVSGKKISLKQRSTMQEAISAPRSPPAWYCAASKIFSFRKPTRLPPRPLPRPYRQSESAK